MRNQLKLAIAAFAVMTSASAFAQNNDTTTTNQSTVDAKGVALTDQTRVTAMSKDINSPYTVAAKARFTGTMHGATGGGGKPSSALASGGGGQASKPARVPISHS